MDLISTVYGSRRPETYLGQIPISSKWFHECATRCDVSSKNAAVFVSSCPLSPSCAYPNDDEDSPIPLPVNPRGKLASASENLQKNQEQCAISGKYFVYVCDLNTPWDVQLVTYTSSEISTLKWDGSGGNSFVLADASGLVEVWQMQESLLSEWTNIFRSTYNSEVFIKAFFIPTSRRTYINMDNMDASQFHDKFAFRSAPPVAQEFGQRDLLGILLVSHTGLVVCLAIPKKCQGANETKVAKQCLNVTRSRVRLVDIAFVNDGSLLIATSNGDPNEPIRFSRVQATLKECAYDDGLQLCLELETFPGLCSRSVAAESEDRCLAIVDLSFVNSDDTDSIVVATKHPAGGRLELWELKEFQQNIHKMFVTSTSAEASFSLPAWHYVEQFNGPVSQIVCVSTPKYCFQTGRAAACYVTVAYSDGSIQCLIRDNLQQIGSVDLPKAGNLNEEPSMKLSKASVTICDMSFTSTGNVLLTIDSLGQLYLYRMSPISDPGGPHVPASLQTMLEFCLVSGMDWWDVTVCLKPSHVETVCSRLDEVFAKQTKSIQDYYQTRYMSLKSSLHRLISSPSLEYKAADCHAQLMLHSIYGVFKALLGPAEMTLTAPTAVEKVSILLHSNKKDEANIDALVDGVASFHTEFAVEQSILQSYQHLIQWVTNLALHIMASVPEYKERKGPGSDIITDKISLNMMRELLFIIRLWGRTNEGILPSYTRTADSFDVLAKLFSLLTRLKEGQSEAITDECISLPSQVMIPPLDIIIPPKGLAHLLIHCTRGPISAHFGQEPDLESGQSSGNDRATFSLNKYDQSLIEGIMIPRQYIDSVRHIYLGKKPFAIRECSRCMATSLPPSTDPNKNILNKGWDQRWSLRCPCGGPWKLTCTDASVRRKNLLSSM